MKKFFPMMLLQKFFIVAPEKFVIVAQKALNW